MTRVAISLGGNGGETARLMASAIDMLAGAPATADRETRPIVFDLSVSDLFRTRPVSPIEQPDFLNAAICCCTELPVTDLLATLKLCEMLHGRRGSVRWGPRVLDLDLLVYGGSMSALPEIRIPHPRLRERRFYLEPLAQIAPDLEVPPDGATVAELLAAVPRAGSVRIPWHRATVPTVRDLRPDRPIA